MRRVKIPAAQEFSTLVIIYGAGVRLLISLTI